MHPKYSQFQLMRSSNRMLQHAGQYSRIIYRVDEAHENK